MSVIKKYLTAARSVLLLLAVFTSHAVFALPAGFTNELVVQNLNQPVSMALLPSGEMLILERPGTILIMDPRQAQPSASVYLALPDVDSNGEKGLLDIALDADFANNQYFYLYYHNSVADRARISRFVHVTNHANLLDEVVVWEDHKTDGLQIIPDHWGGGLEVGPDGYLYLTMGDNKDYPDLAQDLSQSAGKAVRIDPSAVDTLGGWVRDGDNSHLIPVTNPFTDGPGGNLDEIWALGLRNPFRAKWDIPTGRFFIGIVGSNIQSGPNASYDDLHMTTLAGEGANFGWPMCEGPVCSSPAPLNYSPPLFSGLHPDTRALMAGMVYRANLYPAAYKEAFFMADYQKGWLRYITFDANGAVAADVPAGGFSFAADAEMQSPVAIEVGPEGAIYYCSIKGGHVGRFMFNNGNQPPAIDQAMADVSSAPAAPVTVNFTGMATDPEADPFTYQWDFGDGVQSTSSSPSYSYATNGAYSARLSVSDSSRTITSAPVLIEIGQAPVVTLDAPADGLLFRAGDVIAMKGSATDADGVLSNDSFKWSVQRSHNNHLHPIVVDATGVSCTPVGSSCYNFTVPSAGHDFSGVSAYRLTLSVTDSDGLVRTQSVSVVPEKVNLSFSSNVPGGVAVSIDQIPRTTPFVRDTLIGFVQTISVPQSVVVAGEQYVFNSWSNGVTDLSQTITVPGVATTYTANYIDVGPQPRVSDGLQVLYAFEAGSGNTVFDVSGVGMPLDLTLSNPADVSWLAGALSVNQSTLITSLTAASQLNAAITTANEITLEAWVTPANTTQNGPARIVSLSQDASQRNLTLGQGSSGSSSGDDYDVRLRTTTTGLNGSSPSLISPAGSLSAGLMHVVYTRDATGKAKLYLDNVLVATKLVDGDLSNWDAGYQLSLANELTGDRPWIGTLDLVAIYNRVLSDAEIGYNFYQGPDSTTGRIPPLVIATTVLPDMLLGANYNQTVSVSGGIPVYSWALDSGTLPAGLSLDSVTGVVSGVSTVAGSYPFSLKVSDAAGAITTQSFSISVLLDTDGDGLADVDEINIYGTDPLLADTDADGLNDGDEVNLYLTNPLSNDTDGDGLLDNFEITNGFDPLLIGEQLLDGDSDGLNNLGEQTAGTDPANADSDGDGLSDGSEVNIYTTNPLSNDTDGDGLLDNFEIVNGFNPLLTGEELLDSDNDGLNNLAEQAVGTDPVNADSDSDGLNDGDEVNTYLTDPLLADTDSDGLSDGDEVNTYLTNPLSSDSDGDGLFDNFEVIYGFDPLLAGEELLDGDSDGLNNLAEQAAGTSPLLADTDVDGLTDGDEVNIYLTDPLSNDTDGDGLLDNFEITNGFDPLLTGEELLDGDSDGLNNLAEQTAGTDPANADSDTDGLNDGEEVNTYMTDPLSNDTDGDGLLDNFEVINGFDPLLAGEELLDGDNDGLNNLAEQVAGTNPLLADTDADGLSDGDEVNTYLTNPLNNDTDGDGLLDNFEIINGFDPLLTGEELLDGDSDGLNNLAEQAAGTDPANADSDGDGLNDGDEVNTYLTDPLNNDSDGDGLIDGDEVNVYMTDPLFVNIVGDLAPRGLPDGVRNVADVVVLQQLLMGQITPTAGETLLADVNQDNAINAGDLLILMRVVLGLAPMP